MLLQFCALGVTKSWDEGFLGARASRPHNAWHSLDHLPHLDQPATTPWLSFGLADAVPADRVAACSIELKLSGSQRDRMRAGRPRSQDNHSPLEGESQKPSRQAKADAVGGNRAGSGNDRVRNCGYSGLQASRFLKKILCILCIDVNQKSKNIDRQDRRGKQDGTLLHEKPAPAMIVCGIADTQDYKLAVS